MSFLQAIHCTVATATMLLLWFMPILNRSVPFGLNTPTAQLEHPTIQTALKAYRRKLIPVCILWCAAIWAFEGDKAHMLGIQILPLAVLLIGIAISHSCSEPIRAAKRTEMWYEGVNTGVVLDISSNKGPRVGQPWHLWALSTVPLIFATAHCMFHYADMPETVPVHYGQDGPDAWAEKSWSSVFGPIVVALALSLFILATSFLPPDMSLSSPHGSALIGVYLKAARKSAERTMSAVTALAVNSLVCLLVVGTVPSGELSDAVFGFAMAAFFVTIGLAAVWAHRASSRVPPEIAATAGELENPDEDHLWKLGIFYVNKEDPRMFVEKRQGFGQTVNFARWEVWLLAAVLLLPEPFIIYFASRS